MMRDKGIIILVSVLFLCACGRGTGAGSGADGDTLALKYAEHLTMIAHEGYTEVLLADPWNSGKTLHTYFLVPTDQQMPAHLPQGSVIRTPLKRAVIATSVHCGLVASLGQQTAIAGVCDRQYIHLPWVQQGCENGRVADCGSALAPSVEKIIDANADAIFLSPFQNSGGYGPVVELGIPIVETADYMETSALGRAEWMKFYGLLFGAEQQADSIFREVEADYLSLMEKAATASKQQHRQSVLMDKQTGSVWYVPGGKSTIGKMITDAQADYAWAKDDHSGSLALPFERVLESAGHASVWLFRYNSPKSFTYASLLSEHQGYAQFDAFKNQQAYGCNTATSTFYEDTPFHPNLLLRDFITILYPQLTLGEPRYFIRLQE